MALGILLRQSVTFHKYARLAQIFSLGAPSKVLFFVSTVKWFVLVGKHTKEVYRSN
jgi:hypothetical protein